jgi:hypothetical protein
VLRGDEIGLHLGAARLGGGEARFGLPDLGGQLHAVEARDDLPRADGVARVDGHLHDATGDARVDVLVEGGHTARVRHGPRDWLSHDGGGLTGRRAGLTHVRRRVCTSRPPR